MRTQVGIIGAQVLTGRDRQWENFGVSYASAPTGEGRRGRHERPAGVVEARRMPGETDVLISGGGPTGLAAAVELDRRGIACLVVEPRVTVSRLRPRAKTTSIRTMEHFRRWGLAERVRHVAFLPVSWSQDIVFCVNLLGPEVTRFRGCFGMTTERSELFSETSQQIPQPLVEEVLREAVADRLALGWRVVDLRERAGDAITTIESDAGERRRVASSFVLGCDGAASTIRPAIGGRYVGSSHPRPNLTLVFRARELAGLVPHGRAIQYWVLEPGASAYMGPLDLDGVWWIGLIGVDAESDDVDPERLIDRAVGRPIGAKVLSSDPWVNLMLHSDTYGSSRVFLAGDAAHLNPPWGGHGFNTGIGDAVNIGWKLAAVLDGWGGSGLLASYEAERRPVAAQTIEIAQQHTGRLAADFADPLLRDPGPEGDAARRQAGDEIQREKTSEFHGLGLVLGYTYGDSPLIVGDGTPPVPFDVTTYTPSARPGSRVPHAWLDERRSLYDVIGPAFTLLRVAPSADPGPIVRAAAHRRMPLEVVDLSDRGLEPRCEAPLVLVRPDQHVAWRGRGDVDLDALLERVRGAATEAVGVPSTP
jgi:2-polyprenyl-6-methoxyphenol hydroxylase-like FAD-dependent oxidoreductase